MTLMRRIGFGPALAGLVALCGITMLAPRVTACPFCSAVSLTFSEEINNSQVAVIAKLVQAPARAPGASAANSSLDVAKAKFEVVKVVKGADALGKNRTIETVYFGDSLPGATFLIMGIDPPAINWGTPIAISERGVAYVGKAMDLPKEGVDRLAFFQDYLEDGDEMLSRDAYDEFAKAPYSVVLGLKDRIHHDKVLEWVKSTKIPVSRRRLYMTMLGACGKTDDLPTLEEMIQSKDRQTKGALDALVAAYLTLKGPAGMPLVEDLFLKNKDAEYTDTYATIMALRFHGTEEKIIPRERLLEGFRAMLERPQLADLVIPDLARWEDWSVMGRLVDLFKNADDDSNWVRVPVINYLRACPLPAAKERLDELAKIDPDSVKRASAFFPLAAALSASADKTSGDKSSTDKSSADKDSASAAKSSGKTADGAAPAEASAPQKDASAPASSGDSSNAKPARAGSETSPDGKPRAAVVPPLKDAAASPAAPPSNLPIYGGLAAAGVLLSCAFWAILKGGQRTAH